MQPAARRTGWVVWVPEAKPVVGSFRRRFHAEAVAGRIVPHITVLFPFVPAMHIDDEMRQQVASHFAAHQAFEASLDEIRAFDTHAWLAPAPRERFVDLIRATCTRFPHLPPHDGLVDEPEPHLAIGETTDAITTASIVEAARELGPALPLRFHVDAVCLLEELHDGTWAVSTPFPLG